MSRELADQTTAHEALRNLAVELEGRRFAVRFRAEEGRPANLRVINKDAPVLTENVLAAPDAEGRLWFWFPWPAPITPVTDIAAAADRIERVLAEVGRWPRRLVSRRDQERSWPVSACRSTHTT